MKRLSILLATVLAAGGPAAATSEAGLTFPKSRLDFKVAPDTETVTAKFDFRNDTDRAIRVQDIHSNCGCISATTDKEVYEPGDAGTLEAVFKIGSFEGLVEKSVTVQTDSSGERLQRLVVGIEIPVLFEIEPNLSEWLVGEDPEPKTIRFKVLGDDPVHITRITSSRSNFSAELKTVREGREYAIEVTPETTAKLQLGVVRIETDCAIDKHRRKMAFVGIVKKKRGS